jgi:hypothetical protein
MKQVHWAVVRGYRPEGAWCDPLIKESLTEQRTDVTCGQCKKLLSPEPSSLPVGAPTKGEGSG